MNTVAHADSGLSIGDYVAAIKRRRLLVAWIAAPIALIGIVLALALPDVYRSTATFRLVTDRIADAGPGGTEYADQYVFALRDQVLTKESLTGILVETDPYPDLANDESKALSRLRDSIDVRMITQKLLEPGGRERLIHTGFVVAAEHTEPEKAQRVALVVKDAFVSVSRGDQLEAATNRQKFFGGEEQRLSGQIADLERRLATFKSANFERLPEAAQANFQIRGRLEQELDGVEREIRTLQQNRVFVAQQLRQAQAGPTAGNIQQLEEEYARKSAVYAETHPDLVALRRQIDLLRRGGAVSSGNSLEAQLEQQQAVLQEARQRYSEDHPDIRRMVRNIESLEARIAAGEGLTNGAAGSETLMSVQLQTQLNAIDTQVAGLQGRAAGLRSRLVQLESQLGATPEVEREYQEITRGLDNAREQFSQMVGRRLDAEVEIAAITDGAADRFTLFSPPTVPTSAAGPPRAGIMVISMVLAVMLSLTAVMVAEALDSTVRGTRDIRTLLGTSPLGVVPEIHNSIARARRARRVATLAGAMLLGSPVLFLLVRFIAT